MVTLKATIINTPASLRESVEGLISEMALIRRLAALRPRAMTSATASAKVVMRAMARRWLMLGAEVKSHDAALDALTGACGSDPEGGS